MNGDMDDEWFKAITIALVFFISVGVAILLFDAREEPEEKIIVVPTCAELDNVGYDGLISCIDQDGKIVRPGED